MLVKRSSLLGFYFIFRRIDSSCPGFRVRLRDRISGPASCRISESAALGPGGAVQEEGAHPGHQVSARTQCHMNFF